MRGPELEDIAMVRRITEEGGLGLRNALADVDQFLAIHGIVLAVEDHAMRLAGRRKRLLRKIAHLHWRIRQDIVAGGHKTMDGPAGTVLHRIETGRDAPGFRAGRVR